MLGSGGFRPWLAPGVVGGDACGVVDSGGDPGLALFYFVVVVVLVGLLGLLKGWW